MAPPDCVAAIRLTRADLPTLGLPRMVRRGILEGGLKRRMGSLEVVLLDVVDVDVVDDLSVVVSSIVSVSV